MLSNSQNDVNHVYEEIPNGLLFFFIQSKVLENRKWNKLNDLME